ncbi:MAG TPA: FecR domain-containing protein [Polyangia bacterium]|nr:FecR domain-containing protein [Polyangia bacterium]
MDECADFNLEAYLHEMRTLVRRSEAPSARVLRRQKLLPALRLHVAAEQRRRRRWQVGRGWAAAFLGLGAAAGLIAITTRPSVKPTAPVAVGPVGSEVGVEVTRGTVIVNQATGQRALGAGQDINVSASDSLETTGQNEAQVRLASVANVRLREATRLAEIGTRAGQVDRFRLARGSVHLKVNKLAADRRFHVVTPDVEVQVKGTEFDVSVTMEPRPHTCVRVQEGLVQVTAGSAVRLVSAGETWGCADAGSRSGAALPVPGVRPASRRAHVTTEASELGAQNELFERALGDQRAGLYDQAREVYRELLRRYPTGPLAPQAAANLAAIPRDR